jgi:glycine cleavage system transcriptional repressor
MLNFQKNIQKYPMQLVITALGNNKINFIAEILPAIRDCKCNIMEIRSSRLAQATAAYLLVQGNWNQIAKLESTLEALQRRIEIKLHMLRPESREKGKDCMPYLLETLSLNHDSIVESVSSFLLDRDIDIEDITGSCYPAPYIQNPVFSSKFIILIPPQLHLLSLREEFMEFCDQLNIDAILEPIKR